MSEEKNASERDIGYLFSWPLMCNILKTRVERLDFFKEKHILADRISSTNKRVTFESLAATHENLMGVLSLGFKVLHYSGHGLEQYLCMEDGCAGMHAMNFDDFRKLVETAGDKRPKLVFVSACHSENIGRAFAVAGVPHVIAVKEQKAIEDSACTKFMGQLYMSLCVGKSVKDAFHAAIAAVQTSLENSSSQAHKKFLLLPEDGDHSEELFKNQAAGSFIDKTKMPLGMEPKLYEEDFLGQNKLMTDLIKGVKNNKLVCVTGNAGLGKSTVLNACHRYMFMRRLYDECHFINLSTAQDGDLLPWQIVAAEIERNDAKSFSKCPAPACKSLYDLLEKLKRGTKMRYGILLVLDGLDHCLNWKVEEESIDQTDIRYFLAALAQLGCVHVLFACREWPKDKMQISCINHQASVNWFEIKTLNPKDAAKFFKIVCKKNGKAVAHKEYKSRVSNLDLLSKHTALTKLKGHPGHITMAAKRKVAETKTLDELVPYINDIIAEYDKLAVHRVRLAMKSLKSSGSGSSSTTGGETDGPPAYVGGPPSYQDDWASIPPPYASTGGRTGVPPTRAPVGADEAKEASKRRAGQQIKFDVSLRRMDNSGARYFWAQRFPNVTEVSWGEAIGQMHEYFLEQTNQSQRGLDAGVVAWIHKKLIPSRDENGTVTMITLNRFWSWFAGLIDVVCRAMPLWLNGTILGAMEREEVAGILQHCCAGTFILRPSSQERTLVVAYVQNGRIERQQIVFDPQLDCFFVPLSGGQRHNQHSVDALVIKCTPWTHVAPDTPKEHSFDASLD